MKNDKSAKSLVSSSVKPTASSARAARKDASVVTLRTALRAGCDDCCPSDDGGGDY